MSDEKGHEMYYNTAMPLIEAWTDIKNRPKLGKELKYHLRTIGGSQHGDKTYSGLYLMKTCWDWTLFYEAVLA
jgi:hypothetical protein